MTELARVRVAWTGFPGAPGVSTFYALSSTGVVGHLDTMFGAILAYFPADVTLLVEETGDLIEDTTGALTGAWSSSPVTPRVGIGSGAYSAPSGAAITWKSSTILDGKRLRGRTFLVPLTGTRFDSDGSLGSSAVTDIGEAAAALVTAEAGNLVIWHRPRIAAAATAYHPAVTARAGGHGPITASSVRDMAVVLRSRRD